jgi:hypothetical protein
MQHEAPWFGTSQHNKQTKTKQTTWLQIIDFQRPYYHLPHLSIKCIFALNPAMVVQVLEHHQVSPPSIDILIKLCGR